MAGSQLVLIHNLDTELIGDLVMLVYQLLLREHDVSVRDELRLVVLHLVVVQHGQALCLVLSFLPALRLLGKHCWQEYWLLGRA